MMENRLESRVAALERALQKQEPRVHQLERTVLVKDAAVPKRERSEDSPRHPVSEPSLTFQFLSILEDWGLVNLYFKRVPFEKAMFEVGFIVPDNVIYLAVAFSLVYSAFLMGVI